jgi:amino acid transporter
MEGEAANVTKVLTVPGRRVPDLIVAGLIVAGGMYFLGMLIFNRGVLETQPGDADLFAVSSGVTE